MMLPFKSANKSKWLRAHAPSPKQVNSVLDEDHGIKFIVIKTLFSPSDDGYSNINFILKRESCFCSAL